MVNKKIIGQVAISLFCLAQFSCSALHCFDAKTRYPDLSDSLSLIQSCKNISHHLMRIARESDSSAFKNFYRGIDSVGIAFSAKSVPSTAIADSICNRVFGTWNISFDADDSSFSSLLPHRVFSQKHGACLGISLIMLMMSEKSNCPMRGVMVPGHFFCRFDNGSVRYNIEPNKAGFRHPDSYYETRYDTRSKPWYDLHSLTKQEVVGMLCYNAGTILLSRKETSDALFYCKQAMLRLPHIPEVIGNYALCLAQNNDVDSALSVFSALFQAHPDFGNCALNYGILLLSQNRYETAAGVFAKGLLYFPNDTVLQNKLLTAKTGSGKMP